MEFQDPSSDDISACQMSGDDWVAESLLETGAFHVEYPVSACSASKNP
jgi:hypothetical protein